MPVKVPRGLPSAKKLIQENIFVMDSLRAGAQEIRPLRIAVLNLMPNKIDTETQLLRLLSNSPLQVEVVLLTTASYCAKTTRHEHLEAFYRTYDDIVESGEKFDGLIVTGAPVERMAYEDIAYWEELKRIMDWAEHSVYSAMYICWAAQAALHYLYGIEKRLLAHKLSGIFEHRVRDMRNPLVRGFDETFYAPHSRYTQIDADAVRAHPALSVVAESKEAGLHIVCEKGLRKVFVFGHGEYDADTLHREYERDVAAGLDIAPPSHYYEGDKIGPMRWHAHASLLLSNWLNYAVYQATPYDIDAIGNADGEGETN